MLRDRVTGAETRGCFRRYTTISLLTVILAGAVVLLDQCGGSAGGAVKAPTNPPAADPATPTPPPPPPAATLPAPTVAPVSITTYHNDLGRTGLNAQETILSPANVNQAQFGKLFSYAVDGQIYGQPLYLPNVTIAGGTHNVVYVATEHDSVYAFDADGKTTSPLWQVSFLNPAAGITTVDSATDFPVVYSDIQPEIGITSTPVIDPASGTLYVVAKTKENGNFFQRLHALDIATGAEKFGGPQVITASIPGHGAHNDGNGHTTLDPLINNQRSALLLFNGLVYLAFASHGDFDPFNGFLLAYDAHTLQQVIAFSPVPDGAGGSIWMAGDGPAVDAAGNIYVNVANGDFDVNLGGQDYGDSFLKLSGTLQVEDWFTPFNFQALNDLDHDLGSGGVVLLPDQTSGPPHLVIGGGKAGTFYVVNRDSMGHFHLSDNNQIVQQFNLPGGLFGTPAVFQDNVYISSVGGPLQCYKVSAGQLSLSSQAPQTFGFPGSSPAISSNGNSNGIVWALQVDQFDSGPAILHAYDAADVSHELYNSAQAGSRDTAGTAVKFSVPTVANGKVYVGGGEQLTVYGLLH